MKIRILLSNGTSKLHILFLAEMLNRKYFDVDLLLSFYPFPFIRRLSWLIKLPSFNRLLSRKIDVPTNKIHLTLLSEIIYVLSSLLRFISSTKLRLKIRNSLDRALAYIYSSKACKVIARRQPHIYHFRSAFGLNSINVAHMNNAITLCDHSYGHPSLINYMIENNGEYPTGTLGSSSEELTALDHLMIQDLHNTSYIMANSNFVRDNLVNQGISESKIFVAYPGLDSNTLYQRAVSNVGRIPWSLRSDDILFAGNFTPRKGVDLLLGASIYLDCRLYLVGGSHEQLLKYPVYQEINKKNIKIDKYLTVDDLFSKMRGHKYFVFPTLSEGSARVVSMALAAGCCVLTTPNAGSVITDGVNGFIITNPTSYLLAKRISKIQQMSPSYLQGISELSQKLMVERFNPNRYSQRVEQVYHALLSPNLDRNDLLDKRLRS